MRLTKTERIALLMTAVLLLVTAGFYLGRDRDAPAVLVKPAVELPAAAPASGSRPVNINTADAETLQTLSGVGAALAERIIAYREENGGFASVTDITRVHGIGSKIYEQNRDRMTVDGEEETP